METTMVYWRLEKNWKLLCDLGTDVNGRKDVG